MTYRTTIYDESNAALFFNGSVQCCVWSLSWAFSQQALVNFNELVEEMNADLFRLKGPR